MKSVNVLALAQLFWAGTIVASRCKPSLPVSSSASSPSVGSAASYTTPASSSSSEGASNSAATYYPPSSVSYSIPSFSPPPSASSASSSSSQPPQPPVSVSPCGQLVQDPEFALGRIGWDVIQDNGASLTFPGAAVCGVDDGRTSCAALALGPTDEVAAHVVISQTVNTPGAIVDGEPYQIYVQYRIVENTGADTEVVNLITDLDNQQAFSHDLTHESVGGGGSWAILHYQHTAMGTSMKVTVSLTGSAGSPGAGFATAVQIGEVNVVGCQSTTSSAMPA